MEIHSSIRDLKMVIYIIIHRPTGFCYVGQTMRQLKIRIAQHLHGKKQFVDKIIRAEGRDKFEVGVLEVCNSLAQLREREYYWITHFNCKCPHGFNITDGGEENGKNNGRNKPIICLETGEQFESISDASRKLSIGMDRISAVCHRKYQTARGLNFVFADTPMDERKIFAPKRKNRRVICIDTGETFESIADASRKTGANRSSIGEVCHGRQKTAEGLRFVFADIPIAERKTFTSTRGQKRYVLCVDTGEIFESIADAARKCAVNPFSVSGVCHGRRKTTGGLHFAFVDAFK